MVNDLERITYEKLIQVCKSEDARVCPKVRVKDALPVERSGIPNSHYSYALKSHFDFVVTDSEANALFAVEFDGASHDSPEVQRRDSIKNELCEHFGLPLLRVSANHLKARFRQWDLLSYFTETWFLARAFERAQEEGLLPHDELFDPLMVMSDGSGKQWPYWFAAPSQIAIQQLHDHKRIVHRAPSYIVGRDKRDNLHCLAYIRVGPDAWARVRTGMRCQNFESCNSEVLWQIGVVELREQLERVLNVQVITLSDDQLASALDAFNEGLTLCASASVG